jgi:hypothetical protein
MHIECRHIMSTGHKCESPALKDGNYCNYHQRLHKVTRASGSRKNCSFTLPVLEDSAAVQLGLSQVLGLLASGQLEPRRAGQLLYGLQIASGIVPRTQLNLKQSAKPVDRLFHEPDGDVVAVRLIDCTDIKDCNRCERHNHCTFNKCVSSRQAPAPVAPAAAAANPAPPAAHPQSTEADNPESSTPQPQSVEPSTPESCDPQPPPAEPSNQPESPTPQPQPAAQPLAEPDATPTLPPSKPPVSVTAPHIAAQSAAPQPAATTLLDSQEVYVKHTPTPDEIAKQKQKLLVDILSNRLLNSILSDDPYVPFANILPNPTPPKPKSNAA